MRLVNPIIRDRRVLAGLRFRDAPTGETVMAPLDLASDKLRFTRNRSGRYAITGLRAETAAEQQLLAHLDAFTQAPAQPAADSVSFPVTVSDPKGLYIPRTFSVDLPRGQDWDQPIEIDLYPSAAASVGSNWSGLRASLSRQQGQDTSPIAGARVRILRDSDGTELGQGYSDQRGEVLAIAVGIPVIDFTTTPPPANGGGAAQAVGAKTVTTRIEIHTGPGESWPPDPAAIDANGQSWEPVQGALPKPELRTGRLETADLALTLQPQA